MLAMLLGATALFRLTQNMALTTLSLLAREDLHLSATVIGALGALVGLVLAAATLLLSGRVPLRRSAASAAAGTILLVASLALFAFASSLAVLALATVLLGAAGGLTLPGLVNAVVANAGDQRERAIGLYAITLSVSLAVGPLLETAVLDATHQDVRAPFVWFLGFPALAALLLALSCRRRRTAGASAPPALVEPAPPAPPQKGRWGAGGLLATRPGRQALIVQLLYAIPFVGITSFGALVARVGFGVSAAQAQLAFTAFFVASFGARGLIAWRSPIVRKQPLLWASAALTGAGLALLGTGHGLGVLLLAMATLGVPHGLSFPLALALVAESTDRARLPRANAALIGVSNLSTVAVPPLLGVVVPAFGYRGMTLLLLVPVVGFAALLATQTDRGPRRRPPGRRRDRGA